LVRDAPDIRPNTGLFDIRYPAGYLIWPAGYPAGYRIPVLKIAGYPAGYRTENSWISGQIKRKTIISIHKISKNVFLKPSPVPI
jgi:hypothetical protein